MTSPYDKYPVTEKDLHDIEQRYAWHTPNDGQLDRCGLVRSTVKALAMMLMRLCPRSRELSIALTRLEEVMMYANAAIARNEPEKAVRRKTEPDQRAEDAAHQPILTGLA